MRLNFCCCFLFLFVYCFASFAESTVFSRIKRQTSVASNADTSGNGDQVLTDASTSHFKTNESVIVMNVNSNGNSSGNGSATISNSAGGNVGNSSVENVASVMSVGDKANSYSDIFAAVEGENISSNMIQQGKVSGKGTTLSNVNGGGTLQNRNGSQTSGFSYGNAGGTGSISSQAEVLTNQAMSWDQLMSKLIGSASASGIGSAQANIDMGGGINNSNMTISGLVSGLNSGKGIVNTMVTGNGTIDDGSSGYAQGLMAGSSSGKGNSTIVGASSIESNQTSNSEMQAFGNSNAYSSGNSSVNLLSNTGVGNQSNLGIVHISGAGQGSNNYIVASNGLKLDNSENDGALIGSGSVRGLGNDENSKASQSVDTAIDENGVVLIQSNGQGQSIANNGTNSSLLINTNGLVGGLNNESLSVLANSFGLASGQKSNVTGSNFVDIDGGYLNGNASMMAFGGGNGPASADSRAILNLNDNGVIKNGTIGGSVSANGNNTNVQSISIVSSDEGVQTLTNVQRVSSSGGGSSSVSASSSAVFKRKKRFSILEKSLATMK